MSCSWLYWLFSWDVSRFRGWATRADDLMRSLLKKLWQTEQKNTSDASLVFIRTLANTATTGLLLVRSTLDDTIPSRPYKTRTKRNQKNATKKQWRTKTAISRWIERSTFRIFQIHCARKLRKTRVQAVERNGSVATCRYRLHLLFFSAKNSSSKISGH